MAEPDRGYLDSRGQKKVDGDIEIRDRRTVPYRLVIDGARQIGGEGHHENFERHEFRHRHGHSHRLWKDDGRHGRLRSEQSPGMLQGHREKIYLLRGHYRPDEFTITYHT